MMGNTMLPASFYDIVRPALFGGALSQDQVDGIERINAGLTSDIVEFDAYTLATAYKETGRVMQPIREIGLGRGRAYGTTYYGRGLVQITWLSNYARFGKILGINLTKDPDLALDWQYALPILIDGMTQGLFTGRKLSDYFSAGKADPYNARRIVNGLDCTAEIEGYYNTFMKALAFRGTNAAVS